MITHNEQMPTWLESSWQALHQLYSNKHLPHALLLQGEQGIGKQFLAKRLSQALLCESPDNACGQCQSCQLFSEQAHPDFLYINSEPGHAIKVDQVRAAQAWSQTTPALAKVRVVVIDNADCLNMPASNALLKILEEPADNSYFCLTTAYPDRLLPTIRSRCQMISISSSFNSMKALQAIQPSTYSEQDYELALLFANNAPFRASELLTEGLIDECKNAMDSLLVYLTGQPNVCECAESLLKVKTITPWLFLYHFIRSLLELNFTGKDCQLIANVNPDLLAKFNNISALFGCYDLLLEWQNSTINGYNVNQQLLIERLLSQLQGIVVNHYEQ